MYGQPWRTADLATKFTFRFFPGQSVLALRSLDFVWLRSTKILCRIDFRRSPFSFAYNVLFSAEYQKDKMVARDDEYYDDEYDQDHDTEEPRRHA